MHGVVAPLLLSLLFLAGCKASPCDAVVFQDHGFSRRAVLQAQSGAQAVAVDNLSGQTTNQVANASASATAVATSITPLPRTFILSILLLERAFRVIEKRPGGRCACFSMMGFQWGASRRPRSPSAHPVKVG